MYQFPELNYWSQKQLVNDSILNLYEEGQIVNNSISQQNKRQSVGNFKIQKPSSQDEIPVSKAFDLRAYYKELSKNFNEINSQDSTAANTNEVIQEDNLSAKWVKSNMEKSEVNFDCKSNETNPSPMRESKDIHVEIIKESKSENFKVGSMLNISPPKSEVKSIRSEIEVTKIDQDIKSLFSHDNKYKLIIKKLSKSVKRDDLLKLLSPFFDWSEEKAKQMVSIKLSKKGKNKGQCTLTFPNKDTAEKFKQQMDGCMIKNWKLAISYSEK